MAFKCIRQHSGKSREYVNTTDAEIKKWQLMWLHNSQLVAWHTVIPWDLLLVADEDVAVNAKWGFAVVDETMEFEGDLISTQSTPIPEWTYLWVTEDDLTLDTAGWSYMVGVFITTECTNNGDKVIGKMIIDPATQPNP